MRFEPKCGSLAFLMLRAAICPEVIDEAIAKNMTSQKQNPFYLLLLPDQESTW